MIDWIADHFSFVPHAACLEFFWFDVGVCECRVYGRTGDSYSLILTLLGIGATLTYHPHGKYDDAGEAGA